MNPSPLPTSVRGWAGWQLAIWIGLLVAFSPVLLDLSAHVQEHPWARTSLIFPWLLWVAARRTHSQPDGPTPATAGRMDWTLVFLGLAIELVAIAGGSLRFGRVGLALAAYGLCRAFYSLRPEVAALLVWVLPIPRTLIDFVSPGLETIWGQVVAAVVPGVSLQTFDRFPVLASTSAHLPLSAIDGGIALAYGLAGLGWFRMVSRGGGFRQALFGSLRWAMLAIPVQLSFLVAAGLLLRNADTTIWPGRLLVQSSWSFVLAPAFAMTFEGRWPGRRTLSLELAS